MPQRIELALTPEEASKEENYKLYASKAAGIKAENILHCQLVKRSVDARSKQVKIRLFFDLYINEEKINDLQEYEPPFHNVLNSAPIYIIGAGPAGMFAALECINKGFKPILIERGKDVRSRRRDLARINREGIVDADSNYCFGEGGAGTYSDGKLYTRSDKRGDIKRILQTFVFFGADPSILIDAHPHIGTNKLPGIITAIRNFIVESGGEFHFQKRLVAVDITNHSLSGITVCSTENTSALEKIACTNLILATGHSSRDVFNLLYEQGIRIEKKDFALGVRIEHPQQIIDAAQYHCNIRSEFLPPASYTLSGQYNKRGVYSFCMCPGGIIAPAATASGEIVVNGWSPSKRNNPFANSGMVVSVNDDDFKPFASKGELSALYFQHDIEKKCFEAGGGLLKAPAQRMIDFCENKRSLNIPATSYLPGVTNADLNAILPATVTEALKHALPLFGSKMKGYYSNEAVLVATESRTSSPVRIPRDPETCMHPEVIGLFPCGEGAGYAGGIVSAAMDGIRCASKTAEYIQHIKH